jgi:hypothetical protein
MTDKLSKSLNGKKFEGVLAEPIDTGLFMPILSKNEYAWMTYSMANKLTLREKRLDKMAALARHLDIDVEAFKLADPANLTGLMMFYATIAERLASHVVPGFLEKRRDSKNQRDIVRAIRTIADLEKENGKYSNDDDFCMDYIKHERPELARPGRKSELKKRAHTLRNLIAKDRAKAARDEKALHEKTRLRVVK